MQGVLADVELLQEITEASRAAVLAFVSDRTDAEGRVTSNALTNFARLAGLGQQPYLKALKASAALSTSRIDAPAFTASGCPVAVLAPAQQCSSA